MSRETKLYPVPDGTPHSVRVERDDDGYRVTGDALSAHVAPSVQGAWSVVTPDGSFEPLVNRDDGDIVVIIENERFRFREEEDTSSLRSSPSKARATVKAPMPGKVVEILKAVGDPVVSGEGVLLFEAMKMQNEIRSPQDGTLEELHVAVGAAVDARDRLFVIKGSLE